MIGPFQALLTELGRFLHLELHVDSVGACSLLFPSQIVIQLQFDSGQEKLFLFSKIGEIPPGKFRENILRESLKANAMRDPLPGILAYLYPTNSLVAYQSYPLFILNGERLSVFLVNFLSMVESWRTALLNGQTHPSFSEGKTSRQW